MTTALLASLAALGFQYWLVNRAIPVDVSTKYTPAIAKFHQEELVIEDPVIDPSRVLLSLDGKTNEFVDLHFDKARLNKDTVDQFSNRPNHPPVEWETIDFLTVDVRRKLAELKAQTNQTKIKIPATLDINRARTQTEENGTCLMFVKAEVASESKLPTRLRFYQLTGSSATGDSSTRDFYATVDADLLISMKTSPLLNRGKPASPWTPGCGKWLKVGDWEWYNSGFWEVKVIVPANSVFQFTLLQHKRDGLWRSSKDLFQPLVFGSRPLQARAVAINSLNSDSSVTGPPIFKASAVEGAYININVLTLNAEQIQLDFSGMAVVQIRGEKVTESFFERWKKYPVNQAILDAGILALLAWLGVTLKGIFGGRR